MGHQLYDEMAEIYHLMFEDWEASIRRQGQVIAKLLGSPGQLGRVLDAACGIGTQSLALAYLGYRVEGSDISAGEVARARREASLRGLTCEFRIQDMRTLTPTVEKYGAVVVMDNALPHLASDAEILTTLGAILRSMSTGGILLLSLRDYARLLQTRPTFQEPVFYGGNGDRRIYFQVWDWKDDRTYVVHLHLSVEEPAGWVAHHSVGRYRAITVEEMAALVQQSGFVDVTMLSAATTGYHQPIISARAPCDMGLGDSFGAVGV
jgi:glycine/sarcosine N-methyltransferase